MKYLFRISLCICAFTCLFVLTSCINTFSEEDVNRVLGLDRESEPSDMSVEQIVTMMNNAIDPKGKFKTTDTYLLRQKLIDQNAYEETNGFTTKKKYKYDEYETEIKFKAPDMLRQTSIRSGNEFSCLLIRDGRAWSIDTKRNKAEELKGQTLELTRVFTLMSEPSKSIVDAFPNVVADCIYIDKNRIYRLVCRAANPEIAPYVVYVNPKTFLTMRAETILYGDDGEQKLYTATPSRFESINDVMMPMVTFVEVDGDIDVVTLKDFKLGVKFNDSDFEVPGVSFVE